ncbi:hypothetical protein N476_09240 [Pseudoalteromonas luteoviolacea H33]|uniref:Uncharacterized protein n=1 Tax=Pseudoalteromonas luteoviolacea H33 TaxID=1365251 RepID=A0A167FTA4_9GAMM|nr:hypothetical protein N476_09240 [Pseudoalteromonas luteoviolacea H33]KZN78125.1 hypothetical protein N477_10825 [Pseudoalteromonas luteoviolacea H33-S]
MIDIEAFLILYLPTQEEAKKQISKKSEDSRSQHLLAQTACILAVFASTSLQNSFAFRKLRLITLVS